MRTHRLATIALLISLGALLAFDVGGSLTLLGSTVRNPVTIAITSFLLENARPLYTLEQHLLHYLFFSLYSFGMGFFAAIVFGTHQGIAGLTFWFSFAMTLSVRLCLGTAGWEGLAWYSMIPDGLGEMCTVPVYVIGIALGQMVRDRKWPQCSLRDLLIAIAIIGCICSTAMTPSGWTPPLVYLLAMSYLAWRLYPAISLANKRMNRSR